MGLLEKSLLFLGAPPSLLPTEGLEPEVGMGDPRTWRGVKQNLNFLISRDVSATAGQDLSHLLQNKGIIPSFILLSVHTAQESISVFRLQLGCGEIP